VATFNENVDVNGVLTVARRWSDWAFLRQDRDTGGGGGFHLHNPWGNSNQPQGAASRNRLEIGYRTAAGQDLWGQFVIHGPTGNVGIGRVEPTAKLHVSGDVIVTGDIRLQNADCAEDFQLAEGEELAPGTVVVLDEHERVAPSATPYDRRVAGVVAGAGNLRPGIRLGHRERGDRAVPIALVGRVNCWVEGPLAIGDLLTTSHRPGHAMRAADPLQAFGAVLGKALRPLRAGVGLVPVLVALQ
jgi:hypothetical protein